MLEGVSLKDPLFVNTIGHLSGALLFGVLIALLVRGWRHSTQRQRFASLSAALLSFAWNAGSLFGLLLVERHGRMPEWLIAINFSVLSLLPAVLFQVILRRRYIWLARIGFVVAVGSIALHFAELPFPSTHLHEAALILESAGFGALIATVLGLSYLRSARCISPTDAICLFLLILSFLHFGYGHSTTAWTNEVAWHHASIPLAAVVLLRDYRLLFLEAFVRFAANLGLAGLFGFSLYAANQTGRLLERVRGNAFNLALVLVLFCLSLLVFAYLRTLVQQQLTRRLFPRGDLNAHLNRILQIASESETEKELLHRAAAELAELVTAEEFRIEDRSLQQLREHTSAGHGWAQAMLPLRFSRGDSAAVLLGRRRGSRRYLPEDLEGLRRGAAMITEQVERFRANELQRLISEAELKALQAQVNPHFLFNALNTLYGLIDREAIQARSFVLNLAELLRYCLKQDRQFTPLGEELAIVERYFEIEKLRLSDRLSTHISVDPAVRDAMIPVFSIQPIVENAIKHGISRRSTKGEVRVSAKQFGTTLKISVADTGPGFDAAQSKSGLGMGLENVRQRLQLCYGAAAVLEVHSRANGTTVIMTIPVRPGLEARPSGDLDRSTSLQERTAITSAAS